MKIIKFILGSALGAILILVGIGFFLPSHWRVERSVVIKAQESKIYPYIASFKTGWPQWNVFDREDPDIQFTYQGPESGDGASRSWVSKKMGNGIQKITKADPLSGIDFEISMEDGGFVIFGSITMQKHPEGTKVVWKAVGDMGANPVYKVMGYLMDPLMGETLQKSLNHLRDLVQSQNP